MAFGSFYYLPKEFSPWWSQLQNPGCNSFSLHHWGWMNQLVLLEVPTGDPHGHGGLARGYDNPDTWVSATSHCPTPGINHETDQEPIKWVKLLLELVGEKWSFIAGIFILWLLMALFVKCTTKISVIFYNTCFTNSVD